MGKSMIPQNFKIKDFWERPEGMAGMLFGAIALIGGGALLYKALPYLITLAQNTIIFVVELLVLAGLLYVIVDPKFRKLLAYFYKSVMRWITSVFIEIDPIGILKNYIEDLKKSKGNMDSRIAQLRGVIRQLEESINKNSRESEAALKLAREAQKKGVQKVLILNSRQHGRLQQVNVTYSDMLKKAQFLYAVLSKYQDAADIMIQDMEAEVDVESKRREMAKSAQGAMSAAMKILRGQDEGREMYDQAMEYLTYDYGMKIGEIEDFVRVSETFVQSMDLQNGVFEADALTAIEDWEKKSQSLLGDEKSQLLLSHQNDKEAVPVDVSWFEDSSAKDFTQK